MRLWRWSCSLRVPLVFNLSGFLQQITLQTLPPPTLPTIFTHLIHPFIDSWFLYYADAVSSAYIYLSLLSSSLHPFALSIFATFLAQDQCTVFSGGCDQVIKMWNATHPPNTARAIGQHSGPVRCLKVLDENMVVVAHYSYTDLNQLIVPNFSWLLSINL